ncbi:translocation and assembly module lipoprotein TamL [Pararhodonellum marinum]|uniref:translocation and assembly module lipoprotein TamL n=1 Tax=Pararhodonellum marinum TaxID=2755358 RepID=UPI00188E8F51|nr:BamA/TamA family outer membrane protein [Pararhodonellum marinum]
MKTNRLSTLVFMILAVMAIAFTSCRVSRFIPEDEKLYTGAEVKVNSDISGRQKSRVRGDLEALIQPTPNSKFLGMRFGLWAHYKGSKEKPGFINRFLKNKFGQEPVYLSRVNPERTEDLMINRLENWGYFGPEASSEVNEGKNKASVTYEVYVPEPYVLEKYDLDRDSLEIEKEIRLLLEDTELKPGTRFDLQKLKAERERLDEALKLKGYYNFNADFLIFEADTNVYEDRRFDLYLRVKQNLPEKTLYPYIIRDITVFPNYQVDMENGEGADTVTIRDVNFIQNPLEFKPELLYPYLLFKEGQRFNSTTSRLTSNRLSSIGNYRYVNIRFEEDESALSEDGEKFLDAYILLSPLQRRSLRGELEALSKSNNFAGPGLNLRYQNRNLFKGGEIINITAKIAYETQISRRGRSGLNSIELGLRSDLIFPRMIFPVDLSSRFIHAVPKTKVSAGFEYLNRTQLYTLNSFLTSFGYYWSGNRYTYHEINPISINLVNLSNVFPEFEEILESNPFLRRSLEQQFIAGINYTFNYNQLIDKFRTHSIFFGTTLDFAGNLIDLFNRNFSSNPETFLGIGYAQYSKADVDFRYYFRPKEGHEVATRLFGGMGIPYGNTVSLPFVKQYFAGGPNSVRAFRIRSLGPGSYSPPDADRESFFDQAGDIRLEGNIEYRFPLVGFFKGALFVDAGNVWLYNDNEALPGGQFSSDWYKQLGIGGGIGLRVDIDFFVIRLDLATPFHKPYNIEGERWSRNFDILDSGWRRENLILNFGIGYPF